MRSLLIAALFVFALLASPFRPAHASGLSQACQDIHADSGFVETQSGNAGAGFGDGDLNPGETVTLTVTLNQASNATFVILNGYNQSDILAGPATAPGTITYTYMGGPKPNFLAYYDYTTDGNIADAVNILIDCTGNGGTPGAVTWFTPNDSRINGQPGDRIAVYCNPSAKPPTIGVILINTAGIGFEGVNFDYAKLKAAGQAGLSISDRSGNHVSVGTDGHGNFYAAWNGQFGANGQGNFTKSFSCNF